MNNSPIVRGHDSASTLSHDKATEASGLANVTHSALTERNDSSVTKSHAEGRQSKQSVTRPSSTYEPQPSREHVTIRGRKDTSQARPRLLSIPVEISSDFLDYLSPTTLDQVCQVPSQLLKGLLNHFVMF